MSRPDQPGHGGLALLLAFAGGALAGAIAAALLTPRGGAETRRRLAGALDDGQGLAARVPRAIREATGAGREAFAAALEAKARARPAGRPRPGR